MIWFSRLVRRRRDLLIKFANLPIRRAGPALSPLSAQSLPGFFSRLERVGDAAGMAKKPGAAKPIRWNVHKIASKPVWPGEVEAIG
jgi:hypothetical protein